MWTNFPLQIGALLYTIGLIAVQSHLARYGLADLSLLEIQYLAVGIWIVLSGLPALFAILLAESRIAGVNKWLVWLGLFAGVLLALVFISYLFRYDIVTSTFNFNAYPAPKWYVAWNALLWNVLLICVWALVMIGRTLGLARQLVIRAAGVFLAVLTLWYSVFFGRTIYPALSTAVGGGAPQLAILRTDGQARPALVVHTTKEFVHFLPLSDLPAQATTRRATDQLATEVGGPVWQALAANRVVSRSRSDVEIETIGIRQDEALRRLTTRP